jgi:ATP adenylyltransferase
MEKLWSPWRSKYIDTIADKTKNVGGESLFTRIYKEDRDKENFLLYRGKTSFIIMNLYPYNSGHLMIVPYKQVDNLGALDEETRAEMFHLLDISCKILTDTMKPEGFNIGANIGRCSGAGITEHIHFHIVPRWNGDTSFMAVFDDVKIVSHAMEDVHEKLKKALEKYLP